MNDTRIASASLSGAEASADQIRYLCSIVTKVARADLESLLEGHESGIGAVEHGVLRHLDSGVTSMAEMSRLMGVAPSTLVYVVDGLVSKKLVKRGKDPKDRRREPLLLEPRGAALFATIPRMDAKSRLVMSFAGMRESSRRELLLLLREFVEGLPRLEEFYRDSLFEEGTPRAADSPRNLRMRRAGKERRSRD